MRNRPLTTLWAFAMIGALLVAIPAAAQLTTADILGPVTDAARAVVPNAKVTVVNLATSVSYRLSFRAEAYNITNTPNFALPNSAIASWAIKRDPAGIPTNGEAFWPDPIH